MMTRAVRCFLGAIFLLTTGFGDVWAADPPPLAVIIERVVARAEADQKALKSMQYDQTAEIDDLNDAGQVVRHQVRTMIVRPGTEHPVEVTSVNGDAMPTDKLRKTRQGDLQKNVNDGRQDFSLAKMVDRFEVTYAGTVMLEGKPAYLLVFSPKPDQPYDNQAEHVLNHLSGRLWINPESYSIRQTDAHLAEPIKIGYVLASINRLNFHYNFDGANAQALGPARIAIEFMVDIPLWPTIHQEQKLKLTNFRPRD